MSKICRACSTANDSDATACVTCGDDLAAAHPELPNGPAPVAAYVMAPAAAESDAPFYVPTFTPSLLDDSRHLEGIGGWLLLVALAIISAPIVLLVFMIREYVPLFVTPHVWDVLQGQPRLHAVVVFEAATNIISFLIVLALVYLFFKKRKSFPAFYIMYLVLHAAFLIADLFFVHAAVPAVAIRAQDAASASRGIFMALIWIPYLLVSRRVKATFVN